MLILQTGNTFLSLASSIVYCKLFITCRLVVLITRFRKGKLFIDMSKPEKLEEKEYHGIWTKENELVQYLY